MLKFGNVVNKLQGNFIFDNQFKANKSINFNHYIFYIIFEYANKSRFNFPYIPHLYIFHM